MQTPLDGWDTPMTGCGRSAGTRWRRVGRTSKSKSAQILGMISDAAPSFARRAPIGVATGEHCQNRVIFQQLLQAGVNDILAVLLMAAKFGVPVCPHAGGVGLCEHVQRLSIFDYVCATASLPARHDALFQSLTESDPPTFSKPPNLPMRFPV